MELSRIKIGVMEKVDGRTESLQPNSAIGRYLNPQGKAALLVQEISKLLILLRTSLNHRRAQPIG